LRMAISLLSCPASCWHSAVRPIMIRPCDFRLRTIAMCSRYFFFLLLSFAIFESNY
jgi:hypothetical protein